jgi:cellulose synthase (UDP-forming)
MIQLSIIAPLVYLWTGLLPCVNVTAESVLYYLLPMILAVVGGTWVYAPKQYFPFASQVLGAFQSFKILPPALRTIIQPFGHGFKVTPKGRSAAQSNYEGGIFWTSAFLMCSTVVGLVVNTMPEWQVVTESGLLPTVAIWSAVNIVILFLVCMMSLPAPVRRTEERFQIEEPIWMFNSIGTLTSARTRDLSLSGVALVADTGRIANLGEKVSLYITEVGFVRGVVVRCAERTLGIKFDLPPCVERDLLIRKLFTGGMEMMTVNASTWSATFAMLMAIWSSRIGTRTKSPEILTEPSPVAKLPALSVVIQPRIETRQLAVLSAQRRKFAA